MSTPSSSPTYAERLWPGPLGWSAVLGCAAFGFIALLPIALPAAVVGALACGGAAVGAVVATATAVGVKDGELRVGRAHIPVDLLGAATTLDRAGVRSALGPGSDARDYVCVRAWVPTAVRITVEDPADPTPAWLISTRRPDALLAAVHAQSTGASSADDAPADAPSGGQAAHSVQTN